jgi:N,N'-diacetyllegionaminate synthase
MELDISSIKVGKNQPILIIAEAGICHDGSLEKAKQLVDIAKEAGADVVKFQTWLTEELCLPDTEKAEYQKEQTGEEETQFDMIKKLELSYNEFEELKKYCDEKDIIFMSTPDEETSAKFLVDNIQVPAIKVGSGELTNLSYMKFLASFQKPMIVSTGMGTIEEVKEAKKMIDEQGNNQVAFLHCTTDYPAKYEDVNLNAMLTIQKELGTIIGYSDHTMGTYVPLVAAALGAKIIEKHFTYNRLAEGPDHKASLSPDQLKEMIDEIRALEKLPKEERIVYAKNYMGESLFNLIAGSSEKKPTDREAKNKPIVQKSIVARTDLPEGTVLEEKHLVMKRADNRGIPANKYSELLGKKLKQNLKPNDIINFDMLE